MATKVQLSWQGLDQLQGNIANVDRKVKRGMAAAFLYSKPHVETFMKNKAPWTDRTAAARQGLSATVDVSQMAQHGFAEMTLAHGVYYGLYLEVCNGGKYGILDAATQYAGRLILARMERILDLMEAN